MSLLKELRPTLPILIGAAIMLSLSGGIRQSFGLIMPPLTRDIAVSVSDFALAMSVQNLAWGFLQPVAGALAVRVGFRPVMLGGSVLYLAGMLTFAMAEGMLGVMLGAGVLIGLALACTASAIALAVGSRAVPSRSRSLVLGAITASGSLGALLSAPLGQMLAVDFGWRAGVLGFLVLALGMLPAAWIAGRVDRLPLPAGLAEPRRGSAKAALLRARSEIASFLVMTARLLRLRHAALVHRHPSAVLSRDLRHGSDARAPRRWRRSACSTCSAACSSAGPAAAGPSSAFWAASTSPARWCSAGISSCRRRRVGTLVFASAMGFLWLGVGPLVAGSVAEMFGLRWQAMIQGVAFMSHQLGSFLGAFGGGLLYERLGSYDLAWRLGVAIGLTAGIVQVSFALLRPPPRPATA